MAVLHGWKFCPRCRSSLAPRETGLGCGECGFVAYPNPALAACALVERDGRLLLVRRAREPELGKWDVPGGFVDEGEVPEDAVRRELREETGLAVEVGELFGVWTDWYGDAPDAAYNVALVWRAAAAGDPEPADDVSEARWFGPDDLPAADELAFTSVALIVDAWRNENA